MYALSDLQHLGAVQSGYKEVDLNGFIHSNIDDFLKLSADQQASFEGILTLGPIKWVATLNKVPPALAKVVISYNGKLFGKWERDTRTFFILSLMNDKLTVTQKYNFPKRGTEKETRNMAKDLNLKDDLNISGLENMNIDSMKGGAPAAPKAHVEHELTETEKQIKAIQERVAGVQLASADDVILNNQKHGRLLFFVTKTDDTIKIAKKKSDKKDRNGNKILLPSASPEVKKKFQETGKVASTYVEKEVTLVASHSKPGGIVGIAVATPEGSDIDLTKFQRNDVLNATDNLTKVFHLLSPEAAAVYLAANYDGRIKEEEKVLGNRATWIEQQHKPVETGNAPGAGEPQYKVRSSLVVKKTADRTSLLTSGNYFPLKTYQTISQQNLSPENAQVLNLNVEAALKKEGSYEELSADEQKRVVKTADGYVADWFKPGVDQTPIAINRFDSKETSLTDVRVPIRSKVATKDGTSFTFKYEFAGIEDTVNGPLGKKEYRDLIALTGLTPDAFSEKLATLKRPRDSKAGKAVKLSNADYLKSVLAKDAIVQNNISIRDIASQISGLAR